MFGNRDYFSGLAIFLDTYPNVGGEHGVSLVELLLLPCICTSLFLVCVCVCILVNDVLFCSSFICNNEVMFICKTARIFNELCISFVL